MVFGTRVPAFDKGFLQTKIAETTQTMPEPYCSDSEHSNIGPVYRYRAPSICILYLFGASSM